MHACSHFLSFIPQAHFVDWRWYSDCRLIGWQSCLLIGPPLGPSQPRSRTTFRKVYQTLLWFIPSFPLPSSLSLSPPSSLPLDSPNSRQPLHDNEQQLNLYSWQSAGGNHKAFIASDALLQSHLNQQQSDRLGRNIRVMLPSYCTGDAAIQSAQLQFGVKCNDADDCDNLQCYLMMIFLILKLQNAEYEWCKSVMNSCTSL